MAALKGVAGRRVLDRLIEALGDFWPAGVRTVRTALGPGGGLQMWAVPDDPEADDGLWRTTPDGAIELRGVWMPWGYGSWVPLPRRLRLRVEATDALEHVQAAVRRMAPTWPAPDAEVTARVEGDEVVVWFTSRSGAPLPPPIRLPATTFD